MAEERIQRRLAAILAADVVGYSRLMEADEEGTLARMKSLRAELIDPGMAEYGGRIFKTTGDGLLAEFPSAVDAVRHAVDVQRHIAHLNADIPEERRIIIRIGISLGDVMVDGDDLFGNGVNVAARMEGLSEPGSICISGNVQEQIGNTLDVALEDLGEQSVKNIDRPVRCYRVNLQPAGVSEAPLPLPDKPSIAVLPFENMSGDPEQEYFADGIAEDIITALSRFHWFFVIARNSSFSYKGMSTDVRQVAQDLGVQYVLEGSVRKVADRLRISAQLIDALSGRHLWAERYDRDLADIFAVQDEITGAITGAVAPSFVSAEARRVERKPPGSLDAWDCVMRANWHLWQLGRDNLAEARKLFQMAVEIDPKSVLALSGLALACSFQVVWGWADEPTANRAIADDAARRAVALDGSDAWAHLAVGMIFQHERKFDEAAGAHGRALNLNPNLALAEGGLALSHAWLEEYDEAMIHADKAERLSPRDPAQAWWLLARVVAAFTAGRGEEQVEMAQKMTQDAPEHPTGWRFLASGLANLDRIEPAQGALQQYLRLVPHHTISKVRETAPVGRPEHMERLIEGLRKAGLPE